MKKQLSEAQRATLREHAFKPGSSPNPGGRSWKRSLTSAYLELLGQPYPGDRQHRTWAQIIALAVAKRAVKGDAAAAREIADRVEGKAAQAVNITRRDNYQTFTLDSFAKMTDQEMMDFLLECSKVLKIHPPKATVQ